MKTRGFVALATVAALFVALGCSKKQEEKPPAKQDQEQAGDTSGETKAPRPTPVKPAADKGNSVQPRPRVPAPPAGPAPRVLIKTSMGDITVELNPAKAPITVKNFLQYVDDKHYDGTIFHRVISTFMIQGGGFTTSLSRKQSRAPIKNEATNGLKHFRGTIAMARTPVVDSATDQFFINVKDNMFLNHRSPNPRLYGYTVFGKVIKGMDVVDKIKMVPTGPKGMFAKDCPQTNVVIKSIRRVGQPAAAPARPAATPARNTAAPRKKKAARPR